MNLRDLFIIREEADHKDRGRAADATQEIEHALRSNKHGPIIGSGKTSDGISAELDLGELLKDHTLEGLTLAFVLVDRKSSLFNEDTGGVFIAPTEDESQGRIELYTRLVEDRRVSPDKWKKFVQVNARQLFDDRKSIFVHEFIHFLDEKRVGFDEYNPQNDSEYFNDSREFTAYIQQAFTRIENELLQNNNSPILKAAKQGEDGFRTTALKALNKQFVQHLNPEMRKKLEDNIEQLRKYVLSKYGE